MKTHLSDTNIGQSSNVANYARNARKFLIDNVNRITFNSDEEAKLLNTQNSMMRTIMSDLYNQALSEKKLDIFKLLIFDKIDKVPSWFLISWLDIDTLELTVTDKQSADVLNTMSEYRNKILIDITPYYSRKRGMITDTTNFHSRLVRAMLSRSYNSFTRLWLSPVLIYQLTKFYSMILSMKITRIYNLTFQEQGVVTTALSVFFVNRCTDGHNVIDPIMGKLDFLRKSIDTKPIYDFISSKYTSESYDLAAVIDTIIEFLPARISQFNLQTFYSMNANLTSNQAISLIALEYPPYWCHLLISAFSGDKTSLYHSIKSLNLRSDAMEFQANLLKTGSFIRSL